MSAGYEKVEELLGVAYEMEDGSAKLQLFEEAVQQIDALGDVEFAYEVREELIRIAVFNGYKEKALVAFSWCLAQFKKEPEEYDEAILLWMFKWIANNVASFPTVSRDQIVSIQNDMTEQYLKFGFSLRPPMQIEIENQFVMGNLEGGKEKLKQWREHPRDELADCEACEHSTLVRLLIQIGQNEEAIEEAKPIFEEKLTCAEIPHSTHGHILIPHLRLKQLKKAKQHFEKGYQMTRKNREFLNQFSKGLVYCLCAGDLDMGMKMLERHLAWAVETAVVDDQFHFYDSTALLLEAVAGKLAKKTIKLRVPEKLSCHQENDKYDTVELANWFHQKTNDLAALFNKRNGNDYYTQLQQEKRELVLEYDGLG